jgi:uncharacterized protein (TIGR03067 family)
MRNSIRVGLSFALVAVVGLTAAGGGQDAKKEQEKLAGKWTFASREEGGKETPAEQLKTMILTLDGDKFTVKDGDKVVQAGTYTVDPGQTPKTVNATVTEGDGKGTTMLGIYELDGDTMKCCFDPEGKKRPTEFKSTEEAKTILMVHKREK